jgi:hypothetical protein
MKMIKSIVQVSIGAAFGVGMVLSCSDGSPHRSDAATCDCPASEAPIAGRVVIVDGSLRTLQAGELGGASVGCMPGMQFLSGSCSNADPTAPEDITITQFGVDRATFNYGCVFKNNKTVPVQVRASAVCLRPGA